MLTMLFIAGVNQVYDLVDQLISWMDIYMWKENSAAVMFSGGVDSTLTAALLLEEFDQVFLVTYDYGAEVFLKNCEKSLRGLREVFGAERIHHEYVKIEDWWLKMQLRNARTFNLVCMSCKFIMHTRTVCYCLENGILSSSDGSSHEQSQHPEQMGEVLKLLRDYYNRYAVEFTTPAYSYSRAAEDKKLEGLGIHMGKRLTVGDKKGSHMHRQPLCLFAFFDVLFADNPFFPHKEENVLAMLHRNIEYGHDLIRRYFADRGIDLALLIKEREKKHGVLRHD